MNGIVRTFQRGIRTSAPLHDTTASRRLQQFKKLQSEMQADDGRPVFLKRGFMDRVLYISTLLGCAVGLFMNLAVIYDHAKPPSWKKAS